jgi:DNA repair protein RAD50
VSQHSVTGINPCFSLDREFKHLSARYIAEGNDRKIRETESSIEDIKQQILAGNDARTTIEATISNLQEELGKSESLKTNISANIRYRDQMKEIQKVQDELATIDLDAMAKARKEFNVKYKEKMEEENNVNNAVSLQPIGVTTSLATQWNKLTFSGRKLVDN